MKLCPTCKRPLQLDAAQLLCVLQTNHPHREVYKARDGGWFVTYRGGEVDPAAVHRLVAEGEIQKVYSDGADNTFHIGRTWDVARTMAARKELGKNAPDYFVGDE